MLAALRRFADSRWAVPALIALGIALRLAYIGARGLSVFEAEAGNVAVAFAEGRGLADAYFAGSGPTAHFLPTAPLFAGFIYTLFGVHSPLSEALLLAFAFAQLAISTALLARLFTLLGAPRWAMLAAVAWSMVLPVTFQTDTFAFRAWDNGLGFIAILACLIDQVRIVRSDAPASLWRSAATLAIAAFLNPATGAALAIGVFIVYLRRRGFGGAVAVGGATLLIFAAITTPWAIRNERVFGQFIPSRSNAGMELAMANHDAALSAAPAEAVFDARNLAIHPFSDGPGRAAFRRIGEPDYQQALGRETTRWIAAHPGGFATLALRHMYRTVTPEGWQIGETASAARAAIISLASWAGILSLGVLIWRDRRPPWWIVALFLAAALLAYSPFQPMDRYIYPFYLLLLFSGAAGIGALVRSRRGVELPPRTADVGGPFRA